MNVAIIDSGIDRRYVDKIEYGINFLEDKEGKILINNNIEDENGHGTFIYKVLEKSCQDINNYYIFKILNKQKECNSALLLEALKYILKFEIKIVILCLATDIYTKELKDIINEIYKKNIVVVSSLKNKSISSYPAVFKHVIGVKGEILQNENFYIYSKGAIQIISSDLSLYGFDSKNHLYRFGVYFAIPKCNKVQNKSVTPWRVIKLLNLSSVNARISSCLDQIQSSGCDVPDGQLKLLLVGHHKRFHSIY